MNKLSANCQGKTYMLNINYDSHFRNTLQMCKGCEVCYVCMRSCVACYIHLVFLHFISSVRPLSRQTRTDYIIVLNLLWNSVIN